MRSRDLFRMAEELKTLGVARHDIVSTVFEQHFEDYDLLQDHCDAIVVATLKDSRSRPSGSRESIETVHRFHIDELVSGSLAPIDVAVKGKRSRRPRDIPGAPGFKLPNKQELIVLRQGGILRIDGVTFSFRPTFFRFRQGARYVLFLKRTDGGEYYGAGRYPMMYPLAGAQGCVEINDDGLLKSANERLQGILEERYLADKREFVNHLRNRSRR